MIDITTIERVREYHERVLGGHFFREAKKFNGIIYPEVYPGRDGWPIIVTSERQPATRGEYHPRRYTVRQLNERGGFNTLVPQYETRGGFGLWATLRGARRFACKVSDDQISSPANHYGRSEA